MTQKPEKDFFQTVFLSGLRHPAMAIGMMAGLASGGFVAGVGWTLMQADIAEVSRSVDQAKIGLKAINQDIRAELKRIEAEMRASVGVRDARMDRMSNDVAEMKASIRGIDTAIQFLVQHQRQQTRNNGGSVRQ